MNKDFVVLANETLGILTCDHYYTDTAVLVDIGDELATAMADTCTYSVAELDTLVTRVPGPERYMTQIAVQNRGALSCVTDCIALGETAIGCLNFASATRPGGGFVKGAMAQEENLCQCSGLYTCLLTQKAFYQSHQALDGAATDAMIFSPKVPVFRDDATYELLEDSYTVSIITAAAVDCNAVAATVSAAKIEQIMAQRIDKVFALAYAQELDTLILGAWGCGVFGNDPYVIAKLFKTALTGKWQNQFKRVIFAVLDPQYSGRYTAFCEVFN